MEEREVTQQETEDTYEERAERIVSVEERLRDVDTDTGVDYEHRIDLSPQRLFDGGRGTALVTDIQQQDSKCKITCRYEGETHSFDLPWPEDGDVENELLRLCRWADVSPERIGDLDEIPVVKAESGELYLLVPPAIRQGRFQIDLPLGLSPSTTYRSVRDRVNHLGSRIGWRLAPFTVFNVKPDGDLKVRMEDSIFFATCLLLTVAAAAIALYTGMALFKVGIGAIPLFVGLIIVLELVFKPAETLGGGDLI